MEMKDIVLNKSNTESMYCMFSSVEVYKVKLYGIVTANGWEGRGEVVRDLEFDVVLICACIEILY